MPKNKVSDPITDQEIAFARLVLSGAMTDRHAAEAVGLNPDSAAYTKSKPRVRAYMLEHRAAVQQQLVQQEADGHAPPEPRPRTSTGPPLGNRQPQPRNDPRQRYRTGQGPLHDRGHAKLHPRPSRRLFGEEIRPCASPRANLYRRMASPAAGHNPCHNERPAAKPCPRPARRFAIVARQSRRAVERAVGARCQLGGRGASGPNRIVIPPAPACRGTGATCPGEPWKRSGGTCCFSWPQPVHLRQPLYPCGSPRTLCPPVHFCSRHGSGFLYKKEPLSPPLSC